MQSNHPINERLTQQVFSITGVVDVLGVGEESRQGAIQTRFERTTHAGELWVSKRLDRGISNVKADRSLQKRLSCKENQFALRYACVVF